jgi:poly-gamma-glutamate synthesis protein (capsule biosynthesis protein)
MKKIAFVGDLVLQELKKEPAHLFEELKSVLNKESAHLLINLESPFIKEGSCPIKNKLTLQASKQGLPYLSYLDPYLINLSNNHINDYGNESVEYTTDLLKGQSMKYFGVGLKGQRFNLFVDSKEKIVFFAYATRSSDFTGSKLFAEENFYGVKDVDLKEIESVRKKYPSYSLIINVHWGVEDIKYPEPEKVILGRKIIDAGADLVIGHHPHIIQPYEQYHGKYIFYSIGNFYFNDISFELDNKKYQKRSLIHQKRGLMPLFSIKENAIDIQNIFRLNINKHNKIEIKNILMGESASLKLPWNVYTGLYRLYNFYIAAILLIRRICRVVRNPKIVIHKFQKSK